MTGAGGARGGPAGRKRLSPRSRRALLRGLLWLTVCVGALLALRVAWATLALPPAGWLGLAGGPGAGAASACTRLEGARWFDASLRAGASAAEVRARPAARQPRDASATWGAVSRGVWYARDAPPRRAADAADDADGAVLRRAEHLALAAAAADVPGARGASRGPAYVRVSAAAGVQAAVAVRVARDAGAPPASRVVTLSLPPGRPCTLALTRPRAHAPLHVVLPYAARPKRLRAALRRIAAAARRDPALRAVVAARGRDRAVAERIVGELGAGRFASVVGTGVDKRGNFSRAVTLRDAIAQVPSDDAVFVADVDLAVRAPFFRACRVNLVQGSQVWFPIFFSLFPYGRAAWPRDGLWRVSSYGMVCMFRSDFDAVGGFGGDEETRYAGWGSEDVDLYNRFREDPRYAVFRSVEPDLLHLWHGKKCERNEHYDNCMRTVFMTIGSQERLAKIVAKSGVDISELTKGALPL